MKNNKTCAFTALFGAVLAFGATTPSFAQSTTSNFNINAQVETTCVISTMANAQFGNIDGLATDGPSNTDVKATLKCNRGTSGVKLSTNFGLNHPTNICEGHLKFLYLKSEENNLIPYYLIINVVDPYTSANVIPTCAKEKDTLAPFIVEEKELTMGVYLSTPDDGFRIGTYTDTLTVNIDF